MKAFHYHYGTLAKVNLILLESNQPTCCFPLYHSVLPKL